MGYRKFLYCSQLAIDAGITKIGENILNGDESVATIKLPSSVNFKKIDKQLIDFTFVFVKTLPYYYICYIKTARARFRTRAVLLFSLC